MEKGFFESMSSKASFWLGLVGGLGVAFAVGFFILLGQVTGDGGGLLARGDNAKPTNNPSLDGAVDPSAVAPAGSPPEVGSDDHIQGPSNAKVTLIEFSDIQCPFCSRFHPTVKQVREEYADDVRWVYKHFPLDSIHPQARPAAEASECLADQEGDDAFFKYLDALFVQQAALGRATFVSEAVKLGANQKQFEECVDSGKFRQKVEDDYQEGLRAGIRGTPGSYVNNQLVSGAQPYEAVKAIVDSELSK